MANIVGFLKEVKQEGKKITWITRRDVITSTLVVLVMIFFASLFFMLVDGIVYRAVQAVLGF